MSQNRKDRLVGRLNDIWRDDDHERGCAGRTYNCTCGFDDRTYETAEAAATALKAKEAQLAELAAENERLRRELSATIAERKRAQEACQQIANRLVASTGAVKVKPLNWRVFCSRSGNSTAETCIGEYVVQHEHDLWMVYLPYEDTRHGKGFDTRSEAKAAAQADYERRILSTLEPPAPEAFVYRDENGQPQVQQTDETCRCDPVFHEYHDDGVKHCRSCDAEWHPPLQAAPEGQQGLVHSSVLKRSLELMAHSLSQNPQYQALTRPAEQAVTEAAGPFVTFAKHAVEKTDDGWVWRTSGNERICDWFGPSDFGALKAAMEAGRND